MSSLSPLAPRSYPMLPELRGLRLMTAQAGIKYHDRTDLLLMVFDEPASVAGVFTTSLCPSAPVDHCRQALKLSAAKALIVNSGNANAFTGERGRRTVDETVLAAQRAFGNREAPIFVASTGVIGEPLEAEKITRQIRLMAKGGHSADWMAAAQAIMTTDSFPKLVTGSVILDGVKVTVNAIAKGAGMIAPNMATMLCFIVTDGAIESEVLQSLLPPAVERSFNSITVDSDMSTSDSLLLFATGACRQDGMVTIRSVDDQRLSSFKQLLDNLLVQLAVQIVSDGEGARHLLKVNVDGAVDDRSAKKIALAIANSPLVKAAVAGEDANWGRVVMAVGKAGEPADRDKLAIWFNGTRVAVNGERDQLYNEFDVSKTMQQNEIVISVDIGLGAGHALVWGCDLTQEYVAINSDYRS